MTMTTTLHKPAGSPAKTQATPREMRSRGSNPGAEWKDWDAPTGFSINQRAEAACIGTVELEEHPPGGCQSVTKVVPVPAKPFADPESIERRETEREVRTQSRDVRRPSMQE